MNGINKLFTEELVCINIGAEIFHNAVCQQNTPCAHVDWKPPAGGDSELIKILNWIEG